MLETNADRNRESEITEVLCKAWNCTSGSLGPYSPFDRYLYKNSKLSAIIEIKARQNRALKTFDTVYLNLDKYFSLLIGELQLRVPSLYVVAFSDGIYYVKIGQIPAAELNIFIKGREDRPDVKTDVRPALQIPINYFRPVMKGG